MGETRGLIVGAALLMAGCASAPSSKNEACATPTSVEHALSLHASSCTTSFESLLEALDDGSDISQYSIATSLQQAGQYSPAADWYRRADTSDSYQRLLALYAPGGPLQDDANYLRTMVQYAQHKQRFGEAVQPPPAGYAEPLYIQQNFAYLLQAPDEQAVVAGILNMDERVYLLDVVVAEHSGVYWVEVYYPDILQIGWMQAEKLAQTTRQVQDELAFFNEVFESSYSQQTLFAAAITVMDLTSLTPLSDSDFFMGAGIQQHNAQALLRALGKATELCEAERGALQQATQHYLMEEGPRPSSDWYPQLSAMIRALNQPSAQLQQDAYDYFRIRLQGRVNQRLCHSIPVAADQPELTEPACQTLQQFNQCLRQSDAAFLYLTE